MIAAKDLLTAIGKALMPYDENFSSGEQDYKKVEEQMLGTWEERWGDMDSEETREKIRRTVEFLESGTAANKRRH